jgi:type VI secretion system protein VasD
MAGTAIGVILEASGVLKRDSDPSKRFKELSLRLSAGDELNTTTTGVSMSMVAKIYVLRSSERFGSLSYEQIGAAESDMLLFGEDLISVRELVLIPGKSYDVKLSVPGDATALAVVGMYRAPYANRWRIAFDAQKSLSSGIVVGAHACALSASTGTLISQISPDSTFSLVGVSCNG